MDETRAKVQGPRCGDQEGEFEAQRLAVLWQSRGRAPMPGRPTAPYGYNPAAPPPWPGSAQPPNVQAGFVGGTTATSPPMVLQPYMAPGQMPPPAQAAAPSKPGQQAVVELDAHEFVRPEEIAYGDCLGSGGFGQVFRGMYRGHPVAIKKMILPGDSMQEKSKLEELRREIDSLRFLRHPRLVQFIGACLSPPTLCILTELMPGGSLHDLLHVKRVMLQAHDRKRLSLQMAEAVCFLHGHKPMVVHRDLKSMNILLDAACNAKLCDFGLTMPMGVDKTSFARNKGGESGSPRYMAPEFFVDTAKITEKVDIWAMGCVLIEIFGGPVPLHDCQSLQQICTRLAVQRVGPAIPVNFSQALRGCVQRCLEFEVARRCSARDVYGWLSQMPP
eukprot:TRINITY_DN6979_c0_g1_i2.p1 TRINITY_DN6979_c0_g1~~TRINITY_DN6979_c0_g1_i2.p1  ORF type:complete len:388 (-),score=65.40 TRINITY_DN6979_c0_g1_i2:80-1243(-)